MNNAAAHNPTRRCCICGSQAVAVRLIIRYIHQPPNGLHREYCTPCWDSFRTFVEIEPAHDRRRDDQHGKD